MRTAGPAAVMIGLLIRFDCGALREHIPLREAGILLDQCPRRVPELPHYAGDMAPSSQPSHTAKLNKNDTVVVSGKG